MIVRQNRMQVICCLSEKKGFEYFCQQILRKDQLQKKNQCCL